jgi:hypothetical protein
LRAKLLAKMTGINETPMLIFGDGSKLKGLERIKEGF